MSRLTCSLLQELNDWISRRGEFQRLFVWVCRGTITDKQSHEIISTQEFAASLLLYSDVGGTQARVDLTFGGDHQLARQSQWSHRVLVNQSGQTTCERSINSALNWITRGADPRDKQLYTHQSRARWDNPSDGRLWHLSRSGSASPAR